MQSTINDRLLLFIATVSGMTERKKMRSPRFRRRLRLCRTSRTSGLICVAGYPLMSHENRLSAHIVCKRERQGSNSSQNQFLAL